MSHSHSVSLLQQRVYLYYLWIGWQPCGDGKYIFDVGCQQHGVYKQTAGCELEEPAVRPAVKLTGGGRDSTGSEIRILLFEIHYL